LLDIPLSEPLKKIDEEEDQATWKYQDKFTVYKYEYLSVEQNIIDNFCLYALNHSRQKGLSQPFYNVKGWIKAWKMMSNTMKVEFSNMLIDYV
jgi:hypothetical protein